MTNLLHVVPDLDLQSFAHIIPSLERASISTVDLLTLDALDIAKRALVPTEEVRRLANALLSSLAGDGAVGGLPSQAPLSTLDDGLDAALNGGIHSSYLTEIAGESAAGKTQLLLTLLLSVQLKAPLGLDKNALYISTEAPLPTKRLAEILEHNPKLAALGEKCSLNRVQSAYVRDLESQEHVLRYQVPIIIERHDIGLLVIDSIAANYRAEFEKGTSQRAAESIAKRSLQIARLGAYLRDLATKHNIAIVVANQVSDRFDSRAYVAGLSQSTQRSKAAFPTSVEHTTTDLPTIADLDSDQIRPSTNDPLALEHQQRFFTGWGDDSSVTDIKNPSLGLTWTNQLATRIVLLKQPVYDMSANIRPGEDKILSGWDRTLKVVFSAWCASTQSSYEIWRGGMRSKHIQEPE